MNERLPPTEERNPHSAGLDLLETRELVDLLVRDQSEAVAAVRAQARDVGARGRCDWRARRAWADACITSAPARADAWACSMRRRCRRPSERRRRSCARTSPAASAPCASGRRRRRRC